MVSTFGHSCVDCHCEPDSCYCNAFTDTEKLLVKHYDESQVNSTLNLLENEDINCSSAQELQEYSSRCLSQEAINSIINFEVEFSLPQEHELVQTLFTELETLSSVKFVFVVPRFENSTLVTILAKEPGVAVDVMKRIQILQQKFGVEESNFVIRKLFVYELKVLEGMKCKGCYGDVETLIKQQFSTISHIFLLSEQAKVFCIVSRDSIDIQQLSSFLATHNKRVQLVEEVLKFEVYEMKCQNCVSKVKATLNAIAEVNSVDVDLASKTVTVTYETTIMKSLIRKINSSLSTLNYTTSLKDNDDDFNQIITFQFKIPKMKCQSCLDKITGLLKSNINNVEIASDIPNKFVSVTVARVHNISETTVKKIIEQAGYTAEVVTEQLSNWSSYIKTQAIEDQNVKFDETKIEPLTSVVSLDLVENLQTVYVQISGMSCASCVAKIESSVKTLPGILSCDINLLSQTGAVKYDANIISKDKIVRKIKNTGYSTKEIEQVEQEDGKTILLIENMNNEKDADRMSQTVSEKFGSSIVLVVPDLKKKQVTISFNEETTSARYIIKYLNQMDFKASVIKKQNNDNREAILREKDIKYYRAMFWLSAVFTVPLMIITMILTMIPGPTQDFFMQEITAGLTIDAFIAFLLATPVQFVCAAKYYYSSFKVLIHFSTNMDVLIVIGATEAYFFSVFSIIYAMINSSYVAYHYFETSAGLIMFLLLGRWLESLAKRNTSQALIKLMDLQPTTALLFDFEDFEQRRQFEIDCKNQANIDSYNYTDVDSAIDLVQKNDIIKIVPGGKVPVDGIVIYGSSSINEAMITGESLPQYKTIGDEVTGGTINVDGMILVKATRVGAKSTLSVIQKLIENAQTNKPKIQDLANKISGVFVPFVITLSVIVFGVWLCFGYWNVYPATWRPVNMDGVTLALIFFTTVVVVACPCAFGLATPTALMVGTGVGAKLGILIKGGVALEDASKATAIVFDKTGTLTTGQLKVNHVIFFNEQSIDEVRKSNLLSWVASAESSSEHPIAKSIVCHIGQDVAIEQPKEFLNFAGKGVRCMFYDSRLERDIIVHIGNESFMKDEGIETTMLSSVQFEKPQTLVIVAVENQLEMIFALSDQIKEESASLVKYLQKKLRIQVFMLTGDNERVAHSVAAELNMPKENVFASCTPKQKSEKVRELQLQKHRVIMVGDGINDSPSLAQADVGIAIGSTGSQIASETADIVLMNPSILSVVWAISLSKATYRKIIWNFIWAFGYNMLCIPFAAGVFFPAYRVIIPPWIASILMVISSLSVLISSLLLRLYRVPKIIKKKKKKEVVLNEISTTTGDFVIENTTANEVTQ